MLKIITSMMCGGKTSYLLHIIDTHKYVSNVLYINSEVDTRTDNEYSTHSNVLNKQIDVNLLRQVSKGKIDFMKINHLSSLSDAELNEYDVICIDEGQFIEDICYVLHMVNNLKKEVYIGCLNGDFKCGLFGDIHKLFSHVDDIIFLRDTFCSLCILEGHKTKAIFTLKTGGVENIIDIDDGSDKYKPVCRECYLNNNICEICKVNKSSKTKVNTDGSISLMCATCYSSIYLVMIKSFLLTN